MAAVAGELIILESAFMGYAPRACSLRGYHRPLPNGGLCNDRLCNAMPEPPTQSPLLCI